MTRLKLNTLGICTLMVSGLLACSEDPQGGSTESHPVDKANPASEHCAEMGGIPKTKTLPSGDQVAICISPDGDECDAWILMKEKRCEPVNTTE